MRPEEGGADPIKVKGIIVALHAPLTPEGEIHEEAVRDHVEYLIQTGVHGIFFCGTMGEDIFLSDHQRKRVTEIAFDHT